MSKKLKKALSGWKLFIAVTISVLVSGWMLYNSIYATTFIEVPEGKGTHQWVDANHNNKVDLNNTKEFVENEHGNYSQANMTSALSTLKVNSNTWMWLGIALLFVIGRDFFYMLRIRLLSHHKLSWKSSFFVIMLWEFASALSPGVVGGAAVAMFIINRESIAMGKATAMVIITAFMDNLFYVIMIPLLLFFINSTDFTSVDGEQSLILTTWFWVGFAVISAVCILLYTSIFWYPQLASKFLLFVFRLPFLKRYKVVAMEWGKDIETAANQYKKERPTFWYKTFLYTFASWISRYLVINAILNAFIQLSLLENFKILGKQLFMWLFMLVSPTPGGSGVAEYSFGELLQDFSDSALLIVILALIWRLMSYFPYLIIGITLLPFWLRKTA